MKKTNKLYLWIIGIILFIPLFPAFFATSFTLVNQLFPPKNMAGDVGTPIPGEGMFTCSEFWSWSHGIKMEKYCNLNELTDEFLKFIPVVYEAAWGAYIVFPYTALFKVDLIRGAEILFLFPLSILISFFCIISFYITKRYKKISKFFLITGIIFFVLFFLFSDFLFYIYLHN